jgi:hypothetical protein
MAKYMLVANQTIETEELRDAALKLQTGDPSSEFILIVPATRVVRGLVWDEVETKSVARARLESGLRFLGDAGVRVVGGRVGDEDPVLAIEDELRRQRIRLDLCLVGAPGRPLNGSNLRSDASVCPPPWIRR